MESKCLLSCRLIAGVVTKCKEMRVYLHRDLEVTNMLFTSAIASYRVRMSYAIPVRRGTCIIF
jgi:hypothetical protein